MFIRLLTTIFLLGFMVPLGAAEPQNPNPAPAAAPAASPLYQVSLIVFQLTDNANLNSEVWPNQPAEPPIHEAINLQPLHGLPATSEVIAPASQDGTSEVAPPVNPDGTYQVLPINRFGLSRALQKLQSSGDYQILTSLSWLQPLDGETKLIHIYAGTAYDAQGNVIDNPAIVPPQDITATPTEGGAIPARWQLDGTVHVSVSRFIIFSADFLLTQPESVINTDNGDNSTQTQLVSFPLRQTDRMRSNEIHYLDNPMYGVLVLVNKVQS